MKAGGLLDAHWKSQPSSDCLEIIYYISGHCLNQMFGVLRDSLYQLKITDEVVVGLVEAQVMAAFCITPQNAINSDLPTGKTEERGRHEHRTASKLKFCNPEIFQMMINLEVDVYSKLNEVAYLLLMRENMPSQLRTDTKRHPSFEAFRNILLSALKELVEEDQQSISQNLLAKYFEVYVNVACNDIVLTTLTKKWTSKAKDKTTVSFRFEVQMKKLESEEEN
jgi:hypothetical protein